MFKTGFPVIAVFLFAFSGAVAAQEASLESVIEAHIKGLGGKEAIAKIDNVQLEATVTLVGSFGELNGPAKETSDIKNNRYHSLLDLGAFKRNEGWNGKAGWVEDSTKGEAAMTEQEATFAQSAIGVSPLLGIYSNAKETLKLNGESKFNEKPCHLIAMGSDIDFLVNIETGLLEGMNIHGVGAEIILRDYQETDGVMFPSKRSMNIPAQGMKIEYEFTSVKTNAKIEKSMFYKGGKVTEEGKPDASGYSAKEIMSFLDKDGDEKISKDEAKASPQLSPAFAYVDTSKDGFIDMAEAEAMVNYMKNNAPAQPQPKPEIKKAKTTAAQIIASMDKNSDGKISKDEANEELKPFFGDMDSNSDGVIDEKEAEKIAEFVNGNR